MATGGTPGSRLRSRPATSRPSAPPSTWPTCVAGSTGRRPSDRASTNGCTGPTSRPARASIPKGIAGPTTSRWTHLGHHQPYAVYVPDPIPDDLQLVLHGASAGHASLVQQPGAQAVLGDAQRRILVSPFGRGDTGGYVDWSAHDTLAALADAEATYGTDPDTVVVSGYSMGGGGTLALASWFPDRFAAAIAWVPFTGDCLNGTPLAQGHQRPEEMTVLAPLDPTGHFANSPAERSGCPLGVRGNTIDLLENLRHVPTAMLFGAADELVWANHPVAVAQRMGELGYEHRIWVHSAEHLTFGILDDWRNEAAWSTGRRQPPAVARVTYRTNSYEFVPELGIVPDGAYWVDGIEPRNPAVTPDGDAAVDLTSHACPSGGDRQVLVRQDAGLEPLPYLGQYGVVEAETPPDGSARITGTLTNVASLVIDVDRACLGDRPVAIEVTTDGPTEIHFSDGRPPILLG